MTGMPVPLGGIVVNRGVNEDIAGKVNRSIRRSIEYAWADPSASVDFIRRNAREIDSAITKEHISLFVNDFSLSLGQEGKAAISRLYSVAHERKVIGAMPERIFLL
jgi:1,4-dihydroxy-6-naphthoate synthase